MATEMPRPLPRRCNFPTPRLTPHDDVVERVRAELRATAERRTNLITGAVIVLYLIGLGVLAVRAGLWP